MNKLIVIGGALAQRPYCGGHTWQFLQYLLGFKSLGWEVLFLDQLQPEMCVDAAGKLCAAESSENVRYLFEVMKGFGLESDFALIYNKGQRYFGVSKSKVLERVQHAALLINVMGYIDDVEILQRAPRRVFLDTDPGYGQMWRALGLADLFVNHHDYVTIGENIGQPDCTIPTCGINWITTPQPIALEQWPSQSVSALGRLTSIGSWRGAYGPIEYQGQTYGLRVHEFRKFMELPQLTQQPFEIALQIHNEEKQDLERLRVNGWALADPAIVARDPWIYRRYIQTCKAEFMVARNMYVQSNCGWFSERSMCYLASGKPVLAQDTGLARLYALGKGVLTFSNLEEARNAVTELSRNYGMHAKAAREFAETYFDAKKVLPRLLNKLSV